MLYSKQVKRLLLITQTHKKRFIPPNLQPQCSTGNKACSLSPGGKKTEKKKNKSESLPKAIENTNLKQVL